MPPVEVNSWRHPLEFLCCEAGNILSSSGHNNVALSLDIANFTYCSCKGDGIYIVDTFHSLCKTQTSTLSIRCQQFPSPHSQRRALVSDFLVFCDGADLASSWKLKHKSPGTLYLPRANTAEQFSPYIFVGFAERNLRRQNK